MEIANLEGKIKKDNWQQKEAAKREARRNERSEWLNKAVHQNPLETGKAFIKIFNCDILRAVMREKELLSNGFTPKVNKDLVY